MVDTNKEAFDPWRQNRTADATSLSLRTWRMGLVRQRSAPVITLEAPRFEACPRPPADGKAAAVELCHAKGLISLGDAHLLHHVFAATFDVARYHRSCAVGVL